jgi:hypothetical protein
VKYFVNSVFGVRIYLFFLEFDNSCDHAYESQRSGKRDSGRSGKFLYQSVLVLKFREEPNEPEYPNSDGLSKFAFKNEIGQVNIG